MDFARGVPARFTILTRIEFWALFFALLALAQLPAEYYLASFGPSDMVDRTDWRNAGAAAYSIRHVTQLLVFIPLAPLAIALIPAWIFVSLTKAPEPLQRVSKRLLAISLIAVSLLVTATWSGAEIRRAGFRRAGERMAPLVGAIHAFDAERGRPPHDLSELSPRYLATIHTFGVRGCWPLEYASAPAQADWAWQLQLHCPNGMLTLDRFFYRPTGKYPAWDDLERIGEWAYFWD